MFILQNVLARCNALAQCMDFIGIICLQIIVLHVIINCLSIGSISV